MDGRGGGGGGDSSSVHVQMRQVTKWNVRMERAGFFESNFACSRNVGSLLPTAHSRWIFRQEENSCPTPRNGDLPFLCDTNTLLRHFRSRCL
ncbi:hypothetical protein CDAR_49901 [Caerostris darwini]|uniref:Uncharacterized protein n=1 Tax=Caerostris darwini TaxID=1538125 RepID=A0AAV4UID6_9ARAC|nr:hypothetical protein CDAR_49901 [Caerostris darwini]